MPTATTPAMDDNGRPAPKSARDNDTGRLLTPPPKVKEQLHDSGRQDQAPLTWQRRGTRVVATRLDQDSERRHPGAPADGGRLAGLNDSMVVRTSVFGETHLLFARQGQAHAGDGHPPPPPDGGLPGRPQPHRGLRARLGDVRRAPGEKGDDGRYQNPISLQCLRAVNLDYVRRRTSSTRVAPHSAMLAELIEETRLGRVIRPARAPAWWPVQTHPSPNVADMDTLVKHPPGDVFAATSFAILQNPQRHCSCVGRPNPPMVGNFVSIARRMANAKDDLHVFGQRPPERLQTVAGPPPFP